MKINNIIYCSVSYYEDKYANVIQSKQVIKSFRENKIVVYDFWKSRHKFDFTNKTTKLKIPNKKIFHFIFILFTTILVTFKFRKLNNKAFFTRSIVFAYIINLISKNTVILELHTSPSRNLEKLMVTRLAKRIKFIFISESLKNYYSQFKIKLDCIVLHDGHANKIVSKENLQSHFLEWKNNKRIKLGYYGRYSIQKGSHILSTLVKIMPYVDFYFATLNQNNLIGNNIKENAYLHHDEVYDHMKNMDILLLPIVKINTKYEITAFTSPLKLFEYASTGKCIVASDIQVLREHEKYEAIIFSENTPEAFKEKINNLIFSSKLRKKLSLGCIKLANDHKWSVRSTKIIERFLT